jgi:type IV pilus assembly protein PilF
LCTSGRERESIPEFEEAVKDPLFKSPEIAYINAGKCSVAIGENRKADEYFRRALAASPNNPIAAQQLALLAYRESRLDDARFWMRPVMAQPAPRPDALFLGMCIEASRAIARPSARTDRSCAIAGRIRRRPRRWPRACE